MSKWMILDLGVSLPHYESHGLPKWVSEHAFPFGETLPVEEDLGRALVYVWNSSLDDDAGYTYVGQLFEPSIDREARVLRFSRLSLLQPVRTGLAGDDCPDNAVRPRHARFGYLDESVGRRILREGNRRVFRLSEPLVNTLPRYAHEHHMTEDEVVEAALEAYLAR